MAEQTTLTIPADSALGRLLQEAGATGQPVSVDIDDTRYTLHVDPFEDRSGDASGDHNDLKAALGACAGLLAGVDRDRLLADLRQDGIDHPTER